MDESRYNTSEKTAKKPHPMQRANFISRLFFCWLLPYFVKGLKREHGEDDMYATDKSHLSSKLGDRLQVHWNNQLKTKKPSLLVALFYTFKVEIAIYGVFAILFECVRVGQPLLISKLLSYYGPEAVGKNKEDAYLYGGLIVIILFGQVLIIHNYQLKVMEMGMKLRIAACSLIYRKALKLSTAALAETTIGQMVNLLSNDVGRFEFTGQHMHNLWIAPVECVIVMWLMYMFVGATALVGVSFLLAFIPFQMYMGKKTSQYRLRTAIGTDERVRLMNEIISGIQVIKMYTWEKPFAKLVELSRYKEMKQIRATSTIRAIMMTFNLLLNRVAVFLCILTYILTGNTITATYAYTITSFYAILRNTVTMFFPQAITQFAETKVSADRIKKFLMYEEVQKERNVLEFSTSLNSMNGVGKGSFNKSRQVGIHIRNASIKWLPSLPDLNLKNITFDVGHNQLVAVVGPVGGGKTTLLHTILNELPPTEGVVNVVGTVSYASQEPWIFGGSVRQNIIFGQQFDQKKYEEVVRVCALQRDFTLFPHGDRTLVGERGVSLSGGQRARINLARAVYKEADIYLLDDPLSAVDTHVGKRLFEDCICGYLKSKCVVLVTHQLQYLKTVSRIYLMEDGKVEASGTYQELKQSDSEFTKLLAESKEEERKAEEERRKSKIQEAVKSGETKKEDAPTQEKEHRASGTIKWIVYKSYFNAGGNKFITALLFLGFVFSQIFASSTDYFITIWVNTQQWMEENRINTSGNQTDRSLNDTKLDVTATTPTSFQEKLRSLFMEVVYLSDYALYIYSGLLGLTIVVTVLRSLGFFKFCMRASTRLHNRMFNKIVFSPMLFFNTNPSGRILNRFSKDIGNVDEILPITMIDTVQIGLTVLAISVVIGTLNPWILIPMAVILVIFYFIRQVFLASSRCIKRVEAVTRSPIYTHLAASLQGLTTIRAFGAQEILTTEFDNYQDSYTAAYFMFLTANRSFGFWLDLHCVIFTGLVTLSILFIQNETFGGNIGLALTQSMTLTGMFQWGMRQWSELENQMTSVERVQEYAELTPELDEKTKPPPKNWPEDGKVVFRNMCLRYGPNEPYVLRDLTFEIQPREKVGIVGRTGAGKSSLIQALFRLAYIDGAILIDRIDTKSVPLSALRSSISIIPQEPVLFSGTLRKNLDPFDEYSDEILWDSLEQVELKSAVDDLPAGLDSKMAEGGSNFSVGQRQLVCLARAIIRKNKILVLDEATANVDPQTDGLIQSTIRHKFAECTVLTIAHRLHTIMDSDKVLVMDAGRAVEFNHPHLLLRNSEGSFSKLVSETGPSMASNLRSIAEQNFKNRANLE